MPGAPGRALIRAAWVVLALACVQAVAGLAFGLTATSRFDEFAASLFLAAPVTLVARRRGTRRPEGVSDALVIAVIALAVIAAVCAVLLWVVANAE